MKIESRWRFVFDPSGSPVTLLDHGELMEAEPSMRLDRSAEVIQLADAAAPFLRPMGNNVYHIEFTVYRTAANDATARQEVMDALATVDGYGKKPLRVWRSNSSGHLSTPYWTFGQAIIRGITPSPVVSPGRTRYSLRYTITATNLTKTT